MQPDRPCPRDRQGPAKTQAAEARLQRFLRNSHIFSTSVREILSARYRDEVTLLALSDGQFRLLKLIALGDGHPIGKLAALMGVSAPAATKRVDKLERFGLVVRLPHADDRRAIVVAASARGRDLVRRYEDLKSARLAPVLGDFRAREIEQLSELLERFAVSLLQREQPRRGFCLRCAVYLDRDCPIAHVRGGCPYQLLSTPEPAAKESGA